MAGKISKFLKGLIWFCLIIAIVLGGIYIACKYIIKDTTLITQFQTLGQSFGEYLFGNNDKIHVELKDENFKSEVEKARYYHYTQLDDNAKTIYICLENNIDNLKSSQEEIKLPTNLSELMQYNNGEAVLQQAFQDAWDAFSKDKPELFYLDGNKFCLITKTMNGLGGTRYELAIGRGDNPNYFVDGFTSKEQVDIAIQDFENIKTQITQSISIENEEYTYSYEKILQVHDWIVDNVSYDSEMKKANNGNAYGALVEKQSICEGYAEAFKCMMDELQVPCITVCGISKDSTTGKEEKHAWNYVYIGEKWYAIDTTWDDPVINTVGGNAGKLTSRLKYKYFLKGANTMQENHIVTGEIVDGGKIFQYPELSIEDFK